MRNICDISDKIIKIIQEKCIFNEEKIAEIVEKIEKVKRDSGYRAPETAYMDWDNLANILSTYFVPSNSKWETEIMIIFNNLQGNVEDYYGGAND